MLNLVTHYTDQLLGQLFATGGLEVVITGVGLWETMGRTMTNLTLAACEISKCELLGTAGAAILRGGGGSCG